jgi:hypothetical protein
VNVLKDAELLHVHQHHHQIHVIVTQLQLENVEALQPMDQPNAEKMKMLHVKEDVLHQNQNLNLLPIHVIAKEMQLKNVEALQPVDQLLAETTKLLHVL